MPTVPWQSRHIVDPAAEYVVMASRLPLQSRVRVPWFARLTLTVVRQLERADGLVGYSLRAQPLAATFWTLSAWTGNSALDAFVRAMPHRAVMQKLRPHMGRTRSSASWAPLPRPAPAPADRSPVATVDPSNHHPSGDCG